MSYFIPHPKGQSWHRDDFSDDMIPKGYRPLLLLEPCEEGDEVFVGGRWTPFIDKGAAMTRIHLPTRTKRPYREPLIQILRRRSGLCDCDRCIGKRSFILP